MRELVGMRDNVVFSCGVHPLNQDEALEVELCALAAEEGVVAMGKTGLDYFLYPRKLKPNSKSSFRDHIRIGRELNKPVIVHARDRACRYSGYFARRKGDGLRWRTTLFHCEDRETAGKLLDMGFYISRFPVSSLFVTPSSCVMRRATCRWIACWLNRFAVPGAGPPPRQQREPAGAGP